ncbi:MAG: hypothetical protein WCY62_05160 [Clostridia bacterium]
MLYEITDQFLNDMLPDDEGPNISLYQPTHRRFPENRQDLIEFKNLLREIVNLLKQKNEQCIVDTIMEPFYELEKDRDFWNNTLDGIAVLANKNRCIVYKLHSPVKGYVTVRSSFHIKPLIQAFQSVESYQLLELSSNNFSLYQGNRYGLSKIEIDPDVPRTLEAVLGNQKTEPSLTQGSFGGTGRTAVYHGRGDKKDEDEKDTEKYFRYVDRYVYDNYSKVSKLPLILVSLKEYHTQFKNLSSNPYMIEESIDCSYDSVEAEQLQNRFIEVIASLDLKKTDMIIEAYKKAEAESMGSSDLMQVARAAYESRIETILIEENRIVYGTIDSVNGKIKYGNADDPDSGDILDSLTESVLKKKGSVVIVPKDKIPGSTGVAAIYRYN